MKEYIEKMLSMANILGKISMVESFVVIAQSSFKKEKIDNLDGELTERVHIRSFLVPIEQ
ncbi:MAG: hypothetical protein H0Z19_06970 [Archaeoglobus sp.]|uniref:hypothetical protein n=1 Tax=Archaeoglobus sp. TaxID=1872626 RepID=UPI001D2C4F8C|nr:hypothetical protein [Archaeoglobus sp.]MBO8180209.1 hypothetical protein [Archaeoglobus sp.]